MKKVFLQTQFGSPHKWTAQYFRDFELLGAHDWYLKVFTPNPWFTPPGSNIEIINMDVEEFDELVGEQTGVKADNYLTPAGVPAKLVSDYYPAYGQIFKDWIEGFDFWGFTNWDCVYGRLWKYVPDSLLEGLDIWADDASPAINGIFTLMRNDEKTNNLFRQVPEWERCFKVHEAFAFDEIRMTHLVRELAARGEVRFGFPEHFPHHSYDRLVMHRPVPNLYREADGALIERLEDPAISPPSAKNHFGREIMMFHFSRTKVWPL